jgi:hypothetical protein
MKRLKASKSHDFSETSQKNDQNGAHCDVVNSGGTAMKCDSWEQNVQSE